MDQETQYRKALEAIANMEVGLGSNHGQLLALAIAVARIALDGALYGSKLADAS